MADRYKASEVIELIRKTIEEHGDRDIELLLLDKESGLFVFRVITENACR